MSAFLTADEMGVPIRVQLSRAKGWRLPANTVSVARPTRFGNPFDVATFGREQAVGLYRNAILGTGWSPAWVAHMPNALAERVYRDTMRLQSRVGGIERRAWIKADLRGKNLACWCKPGEPCHADVLLEIANS
jgi:hypothetical protein